MVHAQLLAKALVSSCLVGAVSCFVLATPRGGVSQRRCLSTSGTSSPAPGGLSARGMGSRLRAKKKKSDSGRPSLDDVERLSRGQAAKKRGTGSRGVCHRLNESERKVRTSSCFRASVGGEVRVIDVVMFAAYIWRGFDTLHYVTVDVAVT